MAKRGPQKRLGKRELQVALEMRRGGATLQAIGQRLGCSAKHVSTTLQAAEADGERLPAARTGRPRRRLAESVVTTAAPAPSGPVGDAGDLSEALLLEAGEGIGEILFGVYHSEYLPGIKRMIRRYMGAEDWMRMRDAMKADADIRQRVMAAIPPPPPDPEDDPANVAARDAVRAKLADLVTRASAVRRRDLHSKLCTGCAMHVESHLGTGGAGA